MPGARGFVQWRRGQTTLGQIGPAAYDRPGRTALSHGPPNWENAGPVEAAKHRNSTVPLKSALGNAAALAFLPAIGPFLVGLYAFNFGGPTWQARVRTFESFFPSWLLGRLASWPHGPSRLVWIQAVCAVLAFVLSMMSIMDAENAGLGRRVANGIVVLLSPVIVLILFWQSL
jgi:hypothetical protein